MTGPFIRVACVVACVFAFANAASAQILPGTGGIPEQAIPGIGVPVYDYRFAQDVGAARARMTKAVQECNGTEWSEGLKQIRAAREARERASGNPFESDQARAQARADVEILNRYLGENQLVFPTACPSPSPASPFTLILLAGSQSPLNPFMDTTGFDSFFGPSAGLIDRRPATNARRSHFVAGARLRGTLCTSRTRVWRFRGPDPNNPPPDFDPNDPPRIPGADFCPFVEAGFQTGFGADSLVQDFAGINTVPLGFGRQTVRENFQVPVVVGASLPPIGPVIVDFYGGVTIDSWTHTLRGNEAGAPGGPGFYASQDRLTIDPTVGVGLRFDLGQAVGLPGLSVGVNAELQFRPGNVVMAQSNNFPSQRFFGTVDPHANVLITGRVYVPLNFLSRGN
jgi:hypothetical protein